MSTDRTIRSLIASGRDDSVAIAAHDAKPLTYGALRALIDRARASLNGLGIGRGDRVAIVLPNGPEMATAFLSVASAATFMAVQYGGDEKTAAKAVFISTLASVLTVPAIIWLLL